jgi:hypothetical protein
MLRGHCQLALLADEAVLTVYLERLLVDERERAFQELHDFMGWEEDDSMRRFFTRRMPAEEAHVGRWQSDFYGAERARVDTEYEAILDRLRATGVTLPWAATDCHAA